MLLQNLDQSLIALYGQYSSAALQLFHWEESRHMTASIGAQVSFLLMTLFIGLIKKSNSPGMLCRKKSRVIEPIFRVPS